MTTIVTRSGKGSPLTHTEVDTNFTNLNTNKLEAGAIALGSAATPSISFTGDTNTGIYSPGADQVAVATNGTGRLFIDASGNVNAPVSFRVGNGPTTGALSVQAAANGNLHIRDIASVTGSGTGVALDVLNDAGSTVQDLAFRGATTIFRNSAGETLRITSAGLVGIGNSSPGAPLEVIGTAGTISARATTGVSSQAIQIYNNGTDSYIDSTAYGAGSGGGIAFRRNGTGEMGRFDTSGRLLVGTGSDSGGALFQVNGDRIRVATAKTPASAADTGTAGEICWDASYIYVCTATNTWKRSAIATW